MMMIIHLCNNKNRKNTKSRETRYNDEKKHGRDSMKTKDYILVYDIGYYVILLYYYLIFTSRIVYFYFIYLRFLVRCLRYPSKSIKTGIKNIVKKKKKPFAITRSRNIIVFVVYSKKKKKKNVAQTKHVRSLLQ